ncbi:MAG TPA: hypothetical protein VL625_05615 [Patescibacteria group bacterium]|nr:hypothetical protein [Patescibacteria group bacterium]
MEKVASKILGVKVHIGGYYPQPGAHSISFSDIRISSPPGFDTDIAIQIGNVSIKDISSDHDRVVFGKVVLGHVIVFMGIRRDATNLMALLSGIDAAELAHTGYKAGLSDVRAGIFVLRSFPIPLDRNFDPLDVEPLAMKNVGGDATVGEDAVDVLREIMRLCYRSAAKHSYLRFMETSSLQQIQSSLNVGKGFVSVAKNGTLWRGEDEGSDR